MHIAVDVRNLSAGSITGIERVLVETVRALADRGAHFTFYWPGERHASPLDGIAEACHVTSVFSGAAARLVWGEIVLPCAIRHATPDVFWGPAHRLPPFLPASTPGVVTIHDLTWLHFPETMTFKGRVADNLLMRAAIRRARRVVAVSHATARDVTAFFGRRGADVIHPGLTYIAPLAPAALFANIGLRVAVPYALFVGTLEPRKNLPRLLSAFSHARRAAGADWQLVIAGGKGWRDGKIRQVLEQSAASGYVHVTGFVNDSELATLYAHARFLTLPSLYEGFGLPAIEAQQYGVPVLTSRRGSLPEVTGEGGLLVDPLDEGEMATAIHTLFTDNDTHARLSAAARKNARRYRWGATAIRMLEVFEAARCQPARSNLSS